MKWKEKNGGKREKYKKQINEKTQEIEKENQNLRALEESDDAPQSDIDKSRAKIRKEIIKSAYNLADLKNSGTSESEIKKTQAKIRLNEADYTKERAKFNKNFPSEMYQSKIADRDYQEIEDDEGPEAFDKRQRIKSIIKQNQAMVADTIFTRV